MLPPIHDLLTSCFSVFTDTDILLDRVHIDDLLALAKSLPAGTVGGGLECRLAEGRHPVDLGVCVEKDQAAVLLAAPVPLWLKRTIALWINSEDETWRCVPRAWIEFDRPDTSASREEISAAWTRAFPFFAVMGAFRGADPGLALATICGSLAQAGDDHLSQASMTEAQTHLPAGARLLHVGLLSHRGSRELRLQASATTVAVCDWLAASPGPLAASADLLRRLLRDVGVNTLTVQVSRTSRGFSPHSIEICAPHAEADRVWPAILGRAVDVGLATVDKARALLGWPGHHTQIFPNAPARVRIDRIFHVTLRVDGEPRLKGYTYFYPQYVLS